MKTLIILLTITFLVMILIILSSYICFRLAFYVPKKRHQTIEEFDLPRGKIYEPYHDKMIAWTKEVRTLPHEKFCITSFDGLKLCGKYYEYTPDAPIELMFHGYRGNAERDLSGAVQRCFSLERSVLIVDQRTSGLGAKLYGHFNLEETSPIEAMKNCRVPMIFIHGETDDFVPCEMSRANYDACIAPKKLFTVSNAGHGMSYLLDNDGYFKALKEFSEQHS